MKNIQVSEEMYQKLIELATEMTTQDMRCTAMPHLFQIRTKKEVAAADGCGIEAWHCDGGKIEDEDEIIEAIYDYKDGEISKEKIKKLDSWEKEEILEAAGFNKIWYEYDYEYKNSFLTAKACKEHIKLNHYHYSEPVDYLNHSWRNPEMDLVSEFLCGLVNKKMHK